MQSRSWYFAKDQPSTVRVILLNRLIIARKEVAAKINEFLEVAQPMLATLSDFNAKIEPLKKERTYRIQLLQVEKYR